MAEKKTLIIANILNLISVLIFIFSKNYYFFIFSCINLGIAHALFSGTLESLVYSNLNSKGKIDKYKNLILNGHMSWNIGRVLASILAAKLFTINPIFPYLLEIIFIILSLIIIFSIKEYDYNTIKNKNNLNHIKNVFQFIFNKKTIFIPIMFIAIIHAYHYGVWSIFQIYLQEINITIENIGILYGLACLSSIIITLIFKKFLINKIIISLLGIVIIGNILRCFMMISFQNFIGIFFLVAFAFGGILGPLKILLINNDQSEDNIKSTMSSIVSSIEVFYYVSFSMILGYLLEIFDLSLIFYLIITLNLITFIFLINNKIIKNNNITSS